MSEETGVILAPDGTPFAPTPKEPIARVVGQSVLVDNQTDVEDAELYEALREQVFFEEHAGIAGGGRVDSFQAYDGTGSLLTRKKFKPPTNVIEEIRLARDLAERDDDVAPAIDLMISLAFEAGMEHHHPDEQTTTLFNQMAAITDLDARFAEMYREWLIAGQVNTAHLFQRNTLDYTPEGGDGRSRREFSVAVPKIGILPAENIRLLGTDMFGDATLAYDPAVGDDTGGGANPLKDWLEKFFAEGTSPAEKNEMRKDDPISAALFVEKIVLSSDDATLIGSDETVYRLNPGMVARSTAPKGAWQHPRPFLTRSLELLEAKRLLSMMDHALLQGGINYLVVAKKGTDERPARPGEVRALNEVVKKAARSGVIVGDHRLDIEIITPNLEAMLSPARREMIGRKLVQAMFRVPQSPTENPGVAGAEATQEYLARNVSFDRNRLRRHVENRIYGEVVKRNKATFKFGSPKIWFPKIILAGTQYFTDYVLKLRDRGDIPRKWAVEAGGYDYEAGLSQRARELDRGDDEVLAPAAVPFSSVDAGPQDNNEGRPSGTSSNNGAPGARQGTGQDPAAPRRTITRNGGETVKAIAEEHGERVGVTTYAILEQFADTKTVGRITDMERAALGGSEAATVGCNHVVPVNPRYLVDEKSLKVVRLTKGASLFVGRRKSDGALVAKALAFREPEFSLEGAIEAAERWGFPLPAVTAVAPE
jgi:hypothetical protein